MPSRITVSLSVVVLFIFLSTGAVLAADKPLPDLTFDKVQVTAYEELLVDGVAGISEKLWPQGGVLWAVSVSIAPPWTDELKKVNIDYKHIRLVKANGDEIPMIGYFERYGQFRLQTKSLYASRPSKWKDKPESILYNCVFAVPQGETELEFKFGKATAKVTAPETVSPPPNPAEVVKLEIAGARLVDEVKNHHRVGKLKPEPETTAKPIGGRFLEVKIKLTPTKGNSLKKDTHFFWYSPWIGVMLDNGQYVPTIGEEFMGKLNNNVSHNLSKSKDKWGSTEATFYFLVPDGVKSFKLMYRDQPMAEGNIG